MSAKREKLSVVNEPNEQNKKTVPVLHATHWSKKNISDDIDFSTYTKVKREISPMSHQLESTDPVTNSNSKFVVAMNRTPKINWKNTVALITLSDTTKILRKILTFLRIGSPDSFSKLTLSPDYET